MLTKYQIKLAILERLTALSGNCNSSLLSHTDGVIRGLVWAFTGKDPGTYLTEDTAKIFDLVGIVYIREGDMLKWDYPVDNGD